MLNKYIPKNNDLFKLFAQVENNQLPMFIAVYEGIKPLMDTFLKLKDFQMLKQACRDEGIIVEHNNIMTRTPDERFLSKLEKIRNLGTTKMTAIPYSPDKKDCLVHTFISRSSQNIKEAQQLSWYNLFVGEHQLIQPGIDNYRYGLTLGFPECCVRFYAAHNGKYFDGKHRWGWNTPFEVYDNTTGEFSFYCNHLPMDHRYFLIHHYPCSYNCKETIRLARELLNKIEKKEPEYANEIKRILRLPYLVFDEKKAFVFEGKTDRNSVEYTDCYFLGDSRDLKFYREITRGNRIEVEGEQVVVWKDEEEIARYNYPGRLFVFR